MVEVRQAVDHRDGGVGGELLDGGVAEGAQHHDVDVLAEGAGEVGDRLALAQLAVGGTEEDGAAAELGHGRLEAGPGPQRRLLENHAEHAPGQERFPAAGLALGLEARRLLQKGVDLVGAQFHQGQEVPHSSSLSLGVRGWCRHSTGTTNY